MTERDHHEEALSPVHSREPARLQEGVALCLSGGGYRAMLFHLGALWRLNQLGYLPRLDRVSSVSGGSITAAALGIRWARLRFGPDEVAANLEEQLVLPVRRLASRTVDVGAVLGGILLPGTISQRLAGAYRRHLLGDADLQDLPDRPRFVINATNVQTGALWRFSKEYLADYRVGMLREPSVPLALAVAASSAFPPVLSPAQLRLDPDRFDPAQAGPLQERAYRSHVVLSDGGVYDNLGLETAWKRFTTILVSDGGGQMGPDPSPRRDWVRHAVRVNGVIDNQVRNLRKRQIVSAFLRGERKGAYWGIRSHLDDYGPPSGALACPRAATLELALTKTRLKRMDASLQERLINWGYAVCDAAMRRWVEPDAAAPAAFPYPEAGVG
jgi:NTE family protein